MAHKINNPGTPVVYYAPYTVEDAISVDGTESFDMVMAFKISGESKALKVEGSKTIKALRSQRF